MTKEKKKAEKKPAKIHWALPKYESKFTPEDIFKVNNFIAENTIKYKYDDSIDNVIRSAEKCGKSQDSIALYGLSIGLKSIEGEEVTEDNLVSLLVKYLMIFPQDTILLYNDMTRNALKKKS